MNIKQGSIFRAAGIMVVATLASRVLGQLRETAIAAWFGQNATTDVYRVAFLLPDWMFFLIAGGVISAAFVPVFTQYMKEDKPEDAWIVFSTVGTFLGITVTAFVLLGEVIAAPLIPLIFKKFEPWQLEMTIRLTRLILPGQLFFMLGALMMTTLYVRGQFLVPALGPIVYNLAIIGMGWLLHRRIGITGLCWGVLLGSFAGNFALQAVACRRAGVRYRPMLRLRHPGVVKAGKLALPVIFLLSLPQVFSIINRIFGAWLEAGTVSALDNANKLMQIPLGIFGQAISIAVFPAMSMLAAKGDLTGFRRTFVQGTRALWFLTLPLSLLMIVGARECVSLILGYGKFTDANIHVTAIALAIYCTGLIAFACQSILNRAFYAMHNTLSPMIVGTVSTLLFIALNFLLIGPWGYVGLAAAGSLAALINMVWMLFELRRRVDYSILALAGGLARTTAAAAGGMLAGWGARRLLAGWFYGLHLHPKLEALALLGAVMAAGGVVFLGLAHLLRCEEMEYVFRMVLRRRGGQAGKKNAEGGMRNAE